MKKIDMGGFKNEEIEVIFAGETYKIMLDPPIEATRMLIELEGLKMDSNENVDKFKEFVATLISVSNPVDKEQLKKSLTLVSCINFIDGYTSLISKSGGKKKEETNPEKKENPKEPNEPNLSAG